MKNYKIDAKEFLRREKKLLCYLRNRSCAYSISSAASDAYYKANDMGYVFETTWQVYSGNDYLDITISGMVQVENDDLSFVSYALVVAQEERILRKYHYDNECIRGHSKPIFHLQYGGKPLPSHEGHDGVEDMVPWLSEPRLFYTPMSLALILEQVFLEFPDIDTNKIQRDPNWKGHVIDSQKNILVPYFEQCMKISKDDSLYAKCYI